MIKKVALLYSGGRFFGGIEQYLINLFDHINRNEFEIELLSLGEWPLTDKLQQGGHKVVVFSAKRVNPSSVKSIGKYLKDNRFNLIVSQGTVANAYARAVSLIYKTPHLVTSHSVQAGDYSNPVIRTAYGLVERLTRFPTSKYIAVSQHLKQQMIKSGLPDAKIDVVYNGLHFPEPKHIPHKGIVIGSAGRLHPVKGYDLLIQAFAKLDDKESRLKIAGEGEELGRLKALAKDLKVADRVEFVGFKKDVYGFLNTLDIYVQSSISEGFGLAVVEAMSQQLPVVVTPVGSLKEIVADGKTGLVSADLWPESLACAISRLIEDAKLAERIGKNARHFVVENFEIKRWAESTAEAYKKASR